MMAHEVYKKIAKIWAERKLERKVMQSAAYVVFMVKTKFMRKLKMRGPNYDSRNLIWGSNICSSVANALVPTMEERSYDVLKMFVREWWLKFNMQSKLIEFRNKGV